VMREAHEETGLTVEPGEMLGVYERVIRDEERRVRYHFVLIDFCVVRSAAILRRGAMRRMFAGSHATNCLRST